MLILQTMYERRFLERRFLSSQRAARLLSCDVRAKVGAHLSGFKSTVIWDGLCHQVNFMRGYLQAPLAQRPEDCHAQGL